MALKTEYPYTYARVAVMKSKLLARSDYDKLQKMGVGEIIKFLSDHEYKKEIEKFGVTKEGIELVDMALLENTSNMYSKLKKISEPEVRELIEVYLLRNDMHNIKTILRAMIARQDKEKTKEMLIKATKKPESFFEDLMREQDVEKAIKKLAFLNSSSISSALKYYQDTNSLILVENTLDHYLYEGILDLEEKVPSDSRLKDYVRAEIQAMNFKMILKLKNEKKPSSEILPLLIRPKKETVRLAEKSYEDIIKHMKKTIFKDISEGDNLLSMESKIDKRAIQIVHRLLAQKPLSADIILGYLFAKEIEMRNIRLITKAKEFGLPDEFVSSQLVVAK